MKNKRAMHSSQGRIVNANVVQNGSDEVLKKHSAQWNADMQRLRSSNPHQAPNVTVKESFTGAVPKTVTGSKAFWQEAFVELIAMAQEYGVPQYFVTFTANERGWADMTAACGGHHFSERPIESTRHYRHRWNTFNNMFLKPGTESPIGKISRTWWRQEDQARGSLHVHMALWVEPGTERPDGICATAPRSPNGQPLSAEEEAWRQFVLNVQRHDCYPKCKVKRGEMVDDCKYGYPHEIWSAVVDPDVVKAAKSELKVKQAVARAAKAASIISPSDADLDEHARKTAVEATDAAIAVAVAKGELRQNADTGRYEYSTQFLEDQRLSPYVPLWLMAWGASINIQFCTTAAFLSYIAKYVTKPEPYGVLQDTDALREREMLSPKARFLTARIVGAPEAVYRILGYEIKSGSGVTHLPTNPPHKRFRSLARGDKRLERKEQRMQQESELKFADGAIELYKNRPVDDESTQWEKMTYPNCHRIYKFVKHSEIPKKLQESETRSYWRCTDAGKPIGDPDDPQTNDMYAIKKTEVRPIAYDWRLPDRHGNLYYYQKLLLNIPFRDETPTALVSRTPADATLPSNPRGSMREECVCRGLIPNGDLDEVVRREAEKRLFMPEQIQSMVDRVSDFVAIMDLMTFDDEGNGGAGSQGGTAADGAARSADMARLADDISRARGEPLHVVAPLVRDGVWYECRDNGTPILTASGDPVRIRLKAKQLHAYHMLQKAGPGGGRQLVTFLSGEGGMGKSTLIRLLAQYWRSKGLRVIITASSGKAAKLIGGHTVHNAFMLQMSGNATVARLAAKQHTDHFLWLLSADIVIIDEISMLTATALSGVDAALSFVATNAEATSGAISSFGGKTLIAVGDLYQLPAVEEYRKSGDQVTDGDLWPEFTFLELDESCRVDPAEVELGALCSRARVGWEGSTIEQKAADETLLRTRLCSAHCQQCTVFSDVQRVRKMDGKTGKSAILELPPTTTMHCTVQPCADPSGREQAPTVIAALRDKVEELNESGTHTQIAKLNADRLRQGLFPLLLMTAISTDKLEKGTPITNDQRYTETLKKLNKSARGQLQILLFYIGMHGILTHNHSVKDDYVNGTLGRIVGHHVNEKGEIDILYFKPDSYSAEQEPLFIRRRSNQYKVYGHGTCTRFQFPILPSYAVTVHRVQGCTLEGDVHILLNKEFFAEGQAYVALTRIRRLSQLHFWCFDIDAFQASSSMIREYERLRKNPLDDEFIEQHARYQRRLRLPPMAQVAAGRLGNAVRNGSAVAARAPPANAAGSSAAHAATSVP